MARVFGYDAVGLTVSPRHTRKDSTSQNSAAWSLDTNSPWAIVGAFIFTAGERNGGGGYKAIEEEYGSKLGFVACESTTIEHDSSTYLQ